MQIRIQELPIWNIRSKRLIMPLHTEHESLTTAVADQDFQKLNFKPFKELSPRASSLSLPQEMSIRMPTRRIIPITLPATEIMACQILFQLQPLIIRTNFFRLQTGEKKP